MDNIVLDLSFEDIPERQRLIIETIGMEKALLLYRRFDGSRLYVPSLKSLSARMKYQAIRNEFDGSNYDQLAKKYGYTGRWIRFIIHKTKDGSEFSIRNMPEHYRPVCRIIGIDAAVKLAAVFGGEHLHIATRRRLLKHQRYSQIRREFNGSNAKELARKYGYTTRWINMIAKQDG